MAETLPVAPASTDDMQARAKSLFAQPALRRALPLLIGLAGVAMAAMLYLALATGPQRILYASLSDEERASVVAALEQGGVDYRIDTGTGSLTVAEEELYRARMLVASDGALASPESTVQMLDSIPIGASRTLEGERLRNVRESELVRTIMEIDGVEAVRVHLAQAERSVFVRENAPPSASVMVRLARGRNLTPDQVRAIVNLVAGSVPGMEPGMVRVADHRGQLLSERESPGGEGLTLQREYEDKLRAQISALLIPMLGDGAFSSEVQVELAMEEVTSARESYDKDGAVRYETSRESSQSGGPTVGGIPGVLANTPPVDAELVPANETGGEPTAAAPSTNGESSAQRTYALGREVAVSTTAPGAIKRLSVAVAISSDALARIAPANAEQIEELITSAVGANLDRGDSVTVMAGTFEVAEVADAPFYETGWFAMVVRNSVALIAVVLALLLGVRPLVKAISARLGTGKGAPETPALIQSESDSDSEHDTAEPPFIQPALFDKENLREQIGLTQSFAAQQPDRATMALRRMLQDPAPAKVDA